MTEFISTRLVVCIALALITAATDCSKTGSVLKNAYTLMSKGLCADAVAPLQEALKKDPDNEKLFLALCEASLCDKPKQISQNDSQRIEVYCKGGLETGERGFIAYALYLNLSEKKGQSLQVLQEAQKKYPQSKAIEWFLHFDIFTGEFIHLQDAEEEFNEDEVVSDFPKLGLDSLGEVIQTVSGCLANDKEAQEAIVKRNGAGIYLLGEDKVENKFEPATVVKAKDVSADRIAFEDGFHEHWKVNTGWVLIRQDQMDSHWTSGYSHTFIPEKPEMIMGKRSYDWPQTSDGYWYREFKPDPRYVFRNLPDKHSWRDYVVNCNLYYKEDQRDFVSCNVDNITMKAGSFKVFDEEKIVAKPQKCAWGHSNRCRAVYKKVQFEEPDTPLRELKRGDVWLISAGCQPHLVYQASDTLKRFSGIDEKIFDSVLKGEIHKGLPAFFLSWYGFHPANILFDDKGLIVVWKKEGDKTVEFEVWGGLMEAVRSIVRQ